MKEEILNLIKTKPKHYAVIIKRDSDMLNWVMDNSSAINTDHLPTMIYSAIKNESNVCKYGNCKKVSRFNEGYVNCGPANVCKCTSEKLSIESIKSHANKTQEQKHASNKKREQTNIKNHGCAFQSQREDLKHILKKPKISKECFDKLGNYEWLYNEYVKKERTAVHIARELNIHYSTVIDYCRKYDFKIRQRASYSMIEIELRDYILSLGKVCIHSDWELLEDKEIDIYIPENNLAIEIDGLYWHSYTPINNEKKENINRHIDKTILCEEQGIQLLHFTDYQWYNSPDIVKSIIKSKLGLTDKIFARKCQIKYLSPVDARLFYNAYHLDGFCGAKYHIGLYHNEELIQAISIGNSRYSTQYKYELIRLCTKNNVTVVGGASKLFSFFRKNISTDSIFTYCDRNISNGMGYKSIGFEFLGYTKPSYFWTKGNEVISRYKTQPHKLKDLLKDLYNDTHTERDNMFNAGYRIFWGCGNLMLVLR